MNVVQVLSAGPWVERFGWTLLHFLWQGLIIGALYEAVRRVVERKTSAHVRYLLACSALATMMAAPIATWGLLRPSDSSATSAYRIQGTLPSPSGATAAENNTLLAEERSAAPIVQPAQFLLWVVTIWLAGAMVFWVRLAGGWVVAARMRSVQVRPAPPEWQETVTHLAAQIRLSRPVQLLISALVQAPTVVGWLHPVVLAPVGALSGLPREQIEALLLHELAHIRRHDYLVNFVQSVVEALLFYHPAVWWVSADIRAERELCCDDAAVAATGDALSYAQALAQLASYRTTHVALALAANGGSLSNRIARLLGKSRPTVRTGLGPGVLVLTILMAVAAYGLFGQSEARLAFQSVSIKRNTSDWSERHRHPMGMGVNASLMLLIRFSYADHESPHFSPLPASQVVEGPAWIDSEGYDIQAKPPAGSNPKQTWAMWQTLLADRFKLKLHRETRELPVYVMTAAANGLKLPAPKPVTCVAFPPGTKPRHVPGKVDCGYIAGPFMGSRNGTGQHMEGSKVRMADFTRQLAVMLDRPVLNKTGFTGEFDLSLNFTQAEDVGPTVLAALEQQLGLKLSPARSPIEVLVIDHAERPRLD